jgi:RNA polymerase sigma-70 factor (ECF subfamily)
MTASLSALPSMTVVFSAQIQSLRRKWLSAPSATTSLVISTDAELVTKHLAGDPQAFAELVKRYTGTIYNVAYRFTNDAYEAENIAQETFLRAWNVLPRLALDKPLKSYFVKIAVNLCHDWAEQKKVSIVLPLDGDEDVDLPDEGNDPLRAASDTELRERIQVNLELLPPLHRTVITLRYTEEMSYEEMASVLDLPVNTVRTHLHRAKGRLRHLLEQER